MDTGKECGEPQDGVGCEEQEGVSIQALRMKIKSTETDQVHHRLGSGTRCYIRY